MARDASIDTSKEPAAEQKAAAPKKRRRRRRKRTVNDTWQRLVLRSVGWIFIFLGILGLFLPILQGILFLLIGVFILSRVSPRVRLWRQRFRAKARARYPQWTDKFEEAEKKAKAWVHRVTHKKKKKPKRRTAGKKA